jgi:TIR domain/Tetratricopeptide repeat
MAKAFLSHSSRDKQLVEKLAMQLGRANCHYDSLTFEAGMKTLDEILKGLEDTDIFVFFISNSSLESPWVRNEISNARKLSKNNSIEKIFPLIIDKSVNHNDPRIPDWIKKPYNIRFFDNEVLILKKIKQFLRESNFRKYSHLRELNDLYVGRHELNQEFERKVITIDNAKPTCIVASSYFEGIGRRTFLKNGLIKTGIIDKWYEPVPISFSPRESLEDFIYKLNFVEASPDIFKHDFTEDELSTKVALAQEYILKFVKNGEILFIVDEGSIVLPNHTIANWFKEVVSHPRLQNQISICLITKFKPYAPLLRKLGNFLNFQVNELSPPDTQTFFIQYLKLIKQDLNPEDIKFFLQYLKGIPGQIIYAANLIESMGVAESKLYVQDIEEFDELRALSIFEFLKDDNLSIQMLIALSKFEIISYDLVYRIFGESDKVYKSIQTLFDLSLFFSISSSHEYLKLNTSISDYINRSQLELDKQFNEKIREITKEGIQKPLVLNESTDYSQFLFTLQSMIRQNLPIPHKYLIPSFILKSIVQEYNSRHFKTVIELSVKLLENESKFDWEIIRETKNWLCLAYCRTRNEKFFDVVRAFKNEHGDSLKDYYFLLGFFYRNTDRMDLAEDNFLKVLELDENHSRTKRELVNVYLRLGEYRRALNWARDNYYRFKTNILHIQAYFTCLVKQGEEADINIVEELLENANKSLDKKAPDIFKEMNAEFAYYVNRDYPRAVYSLEEALKMNPANYFAYRALLEIYKRAGKQKEIETLIFTYPNLSENEGED